MLGKSVRTENVIDGRRRIAELRPEPHADSEDMCASEGDVSGPRRPLLSARGPDRPGHVTLAVQAYFHVFGPMSPSTRRRFSRWNFVATSFVCGP